jgi:hypothetical protein
VCERGAALLMAVGLVAVARPASATDTIVTPGQSLTLAADIVLTGTDSFIAGAAGGTRCTIDGATHDIQTTTGWTGRIVIANCDITNLGTPDLPALDVADAAAGAVFDVENTTFHTSGAIEIQSFAAITFVFRGNLIAEDSVVHAEIALGDSRPSFHFRGDGGPSQKLFQGNTILRSWLKVEAAKNWLIGGSTPAEQNTFVGIRSGMDVQGNAIVVRGNYVHVVGTLAGWNQIATIYASGDDDALVMEHNIMRGGNWLVRSFAGGDLQYNLLGDPYAIAWVLTSPNANARIHHNVMVRNNKLMETFYRVDGVSLVNSAPTPSTSVYNNTLDGAGYCYDITGRAISMDENSVLASLRSNIFFNLPADNGANTAMVGPGQDLNFQPEAKGDPGPVALGYADYNLFFNPRAAHIDNYGVSVAGLTERVSPGFALHDAPAMGEKDAQVDPQLTGPLPTVWPFSDDDIIAGNVNVCQILAFYRGLYTPKPGSPAIDSGDPADGTGVDIGAVGAGTDDPADRFGRLCSDADSALPTPPTIETDCPQAIMVGGGGTGTGGGGGTPTSHGFVCVCDAGAADSAAPSLAALALLVLCAIVFRPARRRARR